MKKLGKFFFIVILILVLFNLFVFLDFGNNTIDYIRGKAANLGAGIMYKLGSLCDTLGDKLDARANECLNDDSVDSVSSGTESSPRETAAPTGQQGSVTPSFKSTLDEYERLVDSYIAYMKKLKENPDDWTLTASSMGITRDYARAMNGLSSIDPASLSPVDSAYYSEVTARIYSKLDSISR